MGTYACCMFQCPAVAKWLMKGVATVTICWKFDQRKSSKEIFFNRSALQMILHLQVVTSSELPGWGQAGTRSILAGIMRTFYDPCEQVFLQQLLMDLSGAWTKSGLYRSQITGGTVQPIGKRI